VISHFVAHPREISMLPQLGYT